MINETVREAALRLMLSERRAEVQNDVHRRIHDGRTDRSNDRGDDLEQSDTDRQGDLELALLQMKAETLTRIDEALVRLDAGDYGSCVACGGTIAQPRLRALPFAVRCQGCEGRLEQEQRRSRQSAQQRGLLDLWT